jgi:hypothetical protein
VCPKGQTCTGGACVALPPSGGDGGIGDGGFGDAGGGGPLPLEDASLDGGGNSFGAAGDDSKGGCGCETPRTTTSREGWTLAIVAGAIAIAMRRRRRG